MSNGSTVPFSVRDFSAAPRSHFPLSEPHGQIRHRELDEAPHADPPGREEVPVDQLDFCHLESPEEIARISHLREELQLPASVLADPAFHEREKKETSTDSWVHLRCAERLSERSASFP